MRGANATVRRMIGAIIVLATIRAVGRRRAV
jgi:hypothetical protein